MAITEPSHVPLHSNAEIERAVDATLQKSFLRGINQPIDIDLIAEKQPLIDSLGFLPDLRQFDVDAVYGSNMIAKVRELNKFFDLSFHPDIANEDTRDGAMAVRQQPFDSLNVHIPKVLAGNGCECPNILVIKIEHLINKLSSKKILF